MAWKPDYVSVAEADAYLRIGDTDDDVELAVVVSTASRAIDKHTNRQFGLVAAPEARTYTFWYDHERCVWVADIDDLMTTTGLVVVIGSDAVTDYTLEPVNAAAEGKPWTTLRINRTSSVLPVWPDYEGVFTGLWGWSAVPNAVKFAGRLQVSRFHTRRDSPYGVAGAPDQGTQLRLLARLDPDVAVSLSDYVRTRRPR